MGIILKLSVIISDLPVPYGIEDLDIYDLLFLYMTPYGQNVSDECNEASEKYINTLNSVKSNLQKYNSKVKRWHSFEILAINPSKPR